jgi:hypothetical protein
VSGDELPKHVNCIGHQAYLGVHRADLMHKPVKCFNKYENATYLLKSLKFICLNELKIFAGFDRNIISFWQFLCHCSGNNA